jgi:hypothetical protein
MKRKRQLTKPKSLQQRRSKFLTPRKPVKQFPDFSKAGRQQPAFFLSLL